MTIATTVKDYLDVRGITYDALQHYSTGSSHESAEAAHIDEAHIAKAVILTDSRGPVMVVVPGNAWVSLSRVQKTLGCPVVLAEEAETAGLFSDCVCGAVPPLGPAYGIETLLDEALTSLAFHYVESGDHKTLLRLKGPDFIHLLAGARRGHFTSED
ncbi:aminoacyl-tRNA deacylase [Marinobacterium rhizophilum]|uniref:YbaK/EbsC family protein n=1 Tax=Marinobacterium rhizophilum TaxID=420402 RepID=A0ABY5HM93_9GAMM|nr:YbaK/EbsC family protein [Marinobacterium rhizophilum]UTW13001.1 YbaK/EbsC family protein [Marinobacterium rhizophilum]